MKAIPFPEHNRVFVGEGCYDLPVLVIETPKGVEHVSCWQLSEEDLEIVKQTGCVWLGILNSQPPVFVSAEKPFVEAEVMEGE